MIFCGGRKIPWRRCRTFSVWRRQKNQATQNHQLCVREGRLQRNQNRRRWQNCGWKSLSETVATLGWQQKMKLDFLKVLAPKNVPFVVSNKWQKFHRKILIYRGCPMLSHLKYGRFIILVQYRNRNEPRTTESRLLLIEYNTSLEH